MKKNPSLSTIFQLYRGGQLYIWRTTMNRGNIYKNVWFTKLYNIYMGRFGQMMIYCGKMWGSFGRGCFGNGGVLTCIHHLPLFSVHEVNRGTLNILINIIKIRYLRLTFAYKITVLSYPFVHLCFVVRLHVLF
jgi:hypothetical protein